MVILIRVDDRLLHGQIICSWVPFTRADALVVASDEASGDRMAADIMSACGHSELRVTVLPVAEAVRHVVGEPGEARIILVVGDMRDAMRLYDEGVRFGFLNLGNIHHEEGRRITRSVTVNEQDERIIERLISLGVRIEIRDVPRNAPVEYVSRGD